MNTLIGLVVFVSVSLGVFAASPISGTQQKAEQPIPPEEWAAFNAELRAAAGKPKEFHAVHEKWFGKWGRLEKIEAERSVTKALKEKYGVLAPMQFVHDRRLFDTDAWICRFEDAPEGKLTVRFELKKEHYSDIRPAEVIVMLCSGGVQPPTTSAPGADAAVALPLAVVPSKDNSFEVSFSMPPELRVGMVLRLQSPIEPRWVAYGAYPLPIPPAPAKK